MLGQNYFVCPNFQQDFPLRNRERFGDHSLYAQLPEENCRQQIVLKVVPMQTSPVSKVSTPAWRRASMLVASNCTTWEARR